MGRRSRSAAWPTTTARWSPARCSSACPGSPATGTTSPRRGRARRRRAGRRAAARARRARGAGRRRARRDGAAAARFYGDPTAELPVVGITGHERQDDHGVPGPRAARGGRAACGLLGTVTSVVGGEERPRCARRRRRSTSRRRSARCSTPATAPARWRSPRTRWSCAAPTGIHFAAAVFTNLSQDHLDFHPTWRTTSRPSGGCSRPIDRARGSSTSTTSTGGGSPTSSRTPSPFAIDAEADWPGGRRASRLRRHSTFTVARPTASRRCELPLPGRFNVANALGAWAAARALGGRSTWRRCAPPPAVPGRFEPVDEGQPFAVLVDYAHKPGALENVLRAARELADGPRDRRVRRRRRPRPRQAPADGRDRRAARRPRHRHLRQPALRGSRGDHRRDPRRRPRRATWSATSTAAAIAARSALAEPGDVVVIAGKGHEQGQEFAGGRKEPFDDVAVAREALRAREASAGRPEARSASGARRGRRRARAAPAAAPARAVIDSRAVEPGRPLRRPPGRAGRRRRVRRRRAARRRLGRARRAEGARGRGGGRRRRGARRRDPLAALGALARVAARPRRARDRRHRLGRQDVDEGPDRRADRAAPHGRASRANFNTEIGLPLEVLAAPPGTEVLVLELAMRGFGQIAELTAICEPDVGVITNIGPGPPRADGLARGRRARRRPSCSSGCATAPCGRALRTSRCSSRTCATTSRSSRSARRRRALRGRSLRGAARRAPERHVVAPAASGSSSSCRSTRATTCSTRSPRWPRRGRSASGPAGASTSASAALRGERVALARGATSSTTATTPTRCPCAPPSTISPRRSPPDAASRCSATCSSSGRRARAPPRDRRLRGGGGRRPAGRRRPAGGRDARRVRRRGARRRRRGRGGRAGRELVARATSCSSRPRAASGSRSSPRRSARGRGG